MKSAFSNQQKPKKKPVIRANNLIETVRPIGTGVTKTLKKDVVGGVLEGALQSVVGTNKMSGELQPNQTIVFGKEQEKRPRIQTREHMRPPKPDEIETGLAQKIEAVRQELKALAESIKSLDINVHKAISETPAKPGVYHITYYERLRSFLHMMRMKVEDSSSWLQVTCKRKERMGFFGMFKKHGTKWGLSSERKIARAAG